MPAAKCRYCQMNLLTQNAYKITYKKKNAYFCNEEHCKLFMDDVMRKQEEENSRKLLADAKRKAEREDIEKRKVAKDKAYWLICEIIGRPEIINSILWKEWSIWNKVATNEIIAQYLEKNKTYLIDTVGKLDNVELYRIKYLSAILKNSLGDYTLKKKEVEKPKTQVDNTFYVPTTISGNKSNKRRSLADLEDEF